MKFWKKNYQNFDLFSNHFDNRNVMEEKSRCNGDDNHRSTIEICEHGNKEEHADIKIDENNDKKLE